MNVGRASGAWGNFDVWADRLVKREVGFDAFAANVRNDVSRMAWAATKRRRLPYSMGIEDVEALILGHIWYYAFAHKARTGIVGYDPSRGASPGAYLRWNAAQHVQKDIGKARGEDMHTHRLVGNGPETLSKTGEVPESSRDIPDEEGRFDDGRKSSAMQKIAAATKAFVVQQEVARTFATDGDDRVVSFILEQPKEIRHVLGIVGRTGAMRFLSLMQQYGVVEGSRRVAPLGGTRHKPKVHSELPHVVPCETRMPVVEEVETREAYPCEDKLLVEECVPKAAKRPSKYRPTRSDYIGAHDHGSLRGFRRGCRCLACGKAKQNEWVVWEARKQAREKEAILS